MNVYSLTISRSSFSELLRNRPLANFLMPRRCQLLSQELTTGFGLPLGVLRHILAQRRAWTATTR
jgi:hypothetical protein